jgi:hypothetical protein
VVEKLFLNVFKSGNNTGYHVIIHWDRANSEWISDPTEHHRRWQKVWVLNTLARHKAFLRRVLNDSLLVKSELIKQVLTTPLYVLDVSSKLQPLTCYEEILYFEKNCVWLEINHQG